MSPATRGQRSPRRLARRILAAVSGDRYEPAFALAFIGLREGEILGLAHEDIDLDACTATVRYELVGSGPAATRHQLKTKASEATVPLPAFVVARLRSHLERQRQERPDEAPDDGLVFVTERGYAVNGSWLTKHFQALLQRAGLPRMRLHDLRHGAASLLVGAGVHPRIAQELLRHASSKTTMEIYSHVSGAQQREAVEVLQRALALRVIPRVILRQIWAAKTWLERPKPADLSVKVAPAVGLEPTTKRLTAARSTTELRRSEGREGRSESSVPRASKAPGRRRATG